MKKINQNKTIFWREMKEMKISFWLYFTYVCMLIHFWFYFLIFFSLLLLLSARLCLCDDNLKGVLLTLLLLFFYQTTWIMIYMSRRNNKDNFCNCFKLLEMELQYTIQDANTIYKYENTCKRKIYSALIIFW